LIFFHLLKESKIYKAAEEVDRLHASSDLIITCSDFPQMSYIQDRIKKGLGMQPAAGIPMEQVVPKGSVTLQGAYFPAGVIMGINP